MAEDYPSRLGAVREIKVYLSENMYRKVMDEVGLCSCSITGFVRIAIARELIERAKQRKQAARDLPMAGQTSLDGIE